MTGVTERPAPGTRLIGLLALVCVLEGDAHWWGLSGILPLTTGLFRFCPPERKSA